MLLHSDRKNEWNERAKNRVADAMRICIIIREFPKEESLIFGSGFVSQAYYLARALEKLGVEVHVLAERGEKPTTDIMNGIIVHRFAKFFMTAGAISCLGYNFSEGLWIQKLLKEHNIDIIHSHAPTTYVAFLRSRKILRQPLVVTFHGTATGEANAIDLSQDFTLKNLLNKYVNFRLQRLVDQYTCKRADQVTTVCKAMALEVSREYKVPLERIEVITNGIEVEQFARKGTKLRKKLKLGDDPVVLYVGRLIYRKGITYLLRAISGILGEVKDAKFVIVGRGPLEPFIRKYAIEHGMVSAIRFMRDVPQETMPEIYAACDVFVLPSLYEAFPMVILEALASEKAVTATHVGGIPEIIKDGETGVLVKPRDVKALEGSIISLIQDPNKRRQLASNGRALVESEYGWGEISTKYYKLYDKALEA